MRRDVLGRLLGDGGGGHDCEKVEIESLEEFAIEGTQSRHSSRYDLDYETIRNTYCG